MPAPALNQQTTHAFAFYSIFIQDRTLVAPNSVLPAHAPVRIGLETQTYCPGHVIRALGREPSVRM